MDNILDETRAALLNADTSTVTKLYVTLLQHFQKTKYEPNLLHIDELSNLLIPEDVGTQPMVAVKTNGDGNCLYRSISRVISGK